MTMTNNRVILILFVSFIGTAISFKTAKAAEATATEGSKEKNEIEYKSEDLRNPFQEEKAETKEDPQEPVETGPLPDLSIQGMVWGGILPQAIINNRVLKIGDTIEGARITDINKSGVTLFFGNRKYNLTTTLLTTTSKESKDTKHGPKKNPREVKNE